MFTHSAPSPWRFALPVFALLTVALVSGCQSSQTLPPFAPSPGVSGDTATVPPPLNPAWQRGATVGWNRITRELVVKYATGAAPAVRIYTLAADAQYRAVHAVPPIRGIVGRGEDAAAIAGASVAVLSAVYPAESVYLRNRAAEQYLAIPRTGRGGREVVDGEKIGRTIAEAVMTAAKTDGFSVPFTGSVPICPGCWRAVPTPPAFATLGQARTWLVRSGSQFRPAPPPEFGSPKFRSDLAEVRRISDTRITAQDSIAKVWALQNGTVTTLGYWNQLGAELVAARQMDERQAAHTLALMNMAGYDALISSHQAKYTWWVLRPSQADSAIKMAIGLPSFPAYPSNHATISAAAAEVLSAIFPRHRERLAEDAHMAGLSRLYGGIHYRFDMDAGLALGRTIGRYAIEIDRRDGRGLPDDDTKYLSR